MDPSAVSRYRAALGAVSLAVMSASITDFVIIPAVVVASLVAWLVMVYWAASHPQHPAAHRGRPK